MSERKTKLLITIFAALLLVSVGAFFGKTIGTLSCSNGQQLNLGPTVKPAVEIPQAAFNLQNAFADIAEALEPTVVNIATVQVVKQEYVPYEFFFGDPFQDFFDEFFGDQKPPQQRQSPQKRYRERRFTGTGSGVIISQKGYVLTNYHVVGGATEIEVTLNDKRKFKGKVIGQDPKTDLAVIKIDAPNLKAASLGDSDKIRVGEWSIAIGSPFGLEETVTVGIISARRQSLMVEGQQYREMIQTDAAINRGNSGGPLINLQGEVIGINTAIYTPTGGFVGVGFATPINKAKEILGDLIEKGKVTRGWLGVEIRPVDEAVAKQFGLREMSGVLINNVMKDTPAEKAGLKRGDIILEYDGKRVKDATALQDLVAATEPKKKVTLKVWRNNKEENIGLVIAEMPSETTVAEEKAQPGGQKDMQEKEKISKEWLGMKVKMLMPAIAKQLGIDSNEKGVVVVELDEAGKAAGAGIAQADVIRSINRQPVTTVSEFEKVTAKAKLSEGIVFDINRNGRLVYLTVQEK